MLLLFRILRLPTGALGLCLFYVAAFTYESTDKQIQNLLKDSWLKLAYEPRTVAAVANRLARIVLTLFIQFLNGSTQFLYS